MGSLIILLMFLQPISLLPFSSWAKIFEGDSASMTELARAIHPLPPTWSTNSSAPYCDWKGVYCDDSKNVTKIDLHSMSLTGTFPTEFPSFNQLEVLCLSDNLFTGSLPYLDYVPHLKELYLDHNNFTKIPAGFFQSISTHLQVLAFNDNPFNSSWRLDLEFTRFRVLTSFFASNSRLVGPIPDMFGSLSLTNLSLYDNDLIGDLPASLGRSQIKELWLQKQTTGLTGSIDLLSNMTYLSKIGLNGNLFSGPIPDLSNCISLEILNLQYNHLTGVVPLSLASHPSLKDIAINDNNLQGPFPSFLFNDTNAFASVINNNFCAKSRKPCDPQVTVLLEIASSFGYPYNLSLAWTGNNACNNWSFVKCNSKKLIIEVNLGKQRLNGTISPAFTNLTALQFLYLNDNNLTDHIPDSLTKLSHLQLLDVSNNNLYGLVPDFERSVTVNAAGNVFLVSSNGTAHGRTPTGSKANFRQKGPKIMLIIAGTLGTIIGIICSLFIARRIASNTGRKWSGEKCEKKEACSMMFSHNVMGKLQKGVKFQELQLFDFRELAIATNNFHLDNKLGRGGFGLVYKGKLQDGQEIAVKRLSGASGQGLEEFMNEAMVISKLQHRNLVRLLGCCIDGEEKILVYEFMPNKSLDFFLFDQQRCELIDWSKRFSIIEGICRGLLYLHRDSRLRIIHRDLKASNILLDDELNPKISDFGLAKIFGGNESQANTRRVFGTYGYMSPEYAMRGQFSEKSDVFSFGVLTLEIVSGRRNSNLQDEENSLLGYAWKLWSEDNILALVDPAISDPSFHREMLRCIHVGMLCVQNFVKDRPTMSKVAMMLSCEIENLPAPNQPPFVDEKIAMDDSNLQTSQKICTIERTFSDEFC